MTAYHIPVLRDVALGFLIREPHGIYVDGTLGGGGHAEGILERIYPGGRLIGIDCDADALKSAKEKLRRFDPHFTLVHNNNANIGTILESLNVAKIHGLLLDLGVSSCQLDEPGKGFSFRADEVLDLRMDKRQALDARRIVNSFSETQLADIFWRYGEERNARRIAREIGEYRKTKTIERTRELASIIARKVREPYLTKSLARVFQALRIEVNEELERLSRVLTDAIDYLDGGARIVVISYHSLEDRVVKNFFQEKSARTIRSGHKLVPDEPATPVLTVLTKKPIVASKDERLSNPRSRSAKLRVAEKI